MGRVYTDCREHPSEKNCTVVISADGKEELLEASMQHAMSVHGHMDTPESRMQMKQTFKEGNPAA
jgi:predicted small metal-binding protein